MFKQIITPDKKNHSIEMPEKFFGKKVEVTVIEVSEPVSKTYPAPPAGKRIAVTELFENFG